jgi:hypothetical protein
MAVVDAAIHPAKKKLQLFGRQLSKERAAMTTTTRLNAWDLNGLLGSGSQVAFLHNPVIRPDHNTNMYNSVEGHQLYEGLHTPVEDKVGNLLTTPANPLFIARMSNRKVLENMENVAVISQFVAKELPPITSRDINQLYL